MKNNYLLAAALCLAAMNSHAQTWQWAATGGTPHDDHYVLMRAENARSLSVAPDGNVYFISSVSYDGLVIDGEPKEVYGEFDAQTDDALIASFGCDGTYRWSKVIGSRLTDEIVGLGTDAEGNVYAAGRITPMQYAEIWDDPYTHFDNDTILPASYGKVNTYKQSLYLVKYNSEGELQWLRMPQPDDIEWVDSITNFRALDLEVDPEGNTYWLCHMRSGPLANGAYEATGEGLTMHILKYDADGNFVSGMPFPMQATSGALMNFSFRRNHATGRFYVAGDIHFYETSNESVTINGQPVVTSKYVAAFDENAEFLWIRTNYGDAGYHLEGHGLAFDEDNNIYYTTSMLSQTVEDMTEIDGFNSQLFELDEMSFSAFPVLVKMDMGGNTIWQTNGDRGNANAATVSGDEVIITGGANSLTWGAQSSTYPSDQGYHPFTARFNKDTGEVIGLDYIVSHSTYDYGTAIEPDGNGSYYISGRFQEQIDFNDETFYSNGGLWDFFIAKYGSDECTFMGTADNHKDGLQAWPNPVQDILNLNNTGALDYTIFSIVGAEVTSGRVEAHGSIKTDGMAPGMYLVQLQDDSGNLSAIKIVKK